MMTLLLMTIIIIIIIIIIITTIGSSKRLRKRNLGRSMCRKEDNIRMDLKEIGINTRN